jgi:hypothetical protein
VPLGTAEFIDENGRGNAPLVRTRNFGGRTKRFRSRSRTCTFRTTLPMGGHLPGAIAGPLIARTMWRRLLKSRQTGIDLISSSVLFVVRLSKLSKLGSGLTAIPAVWSDPAHPPRIANAGSLRVIFQGDWLMRSFALFAALFISTSVFAQSAAPQAAAPPVGNKPLVQVKPKGPAGCKLVGTVKGTKLWAGDCMASEPGAIAETPPLASQAAGAIPPGQK